MGTLGKVETDSSISIFFLFFFCAETEGIPETRNVETNKNETALRMK
jgi:hypothetical protein